MDDPGGNSCPLGGGSVAGLAFGHREAPGGDAVSGTTTHLQDPEHLLEASLSSRNPGLLAPWKRLSSLPQVQLTWVDGSWHHWPAEQGEAQDPGVRPFSAQMGKLRPRGLHGLGASVFS